MTKRVAIVGGAGFLGQELHRELASEPFAPVVLDVADGVYCDVTKRETLDQNLSDADVVANLAAVHHDNVRPISRYYDVNVEGARNVCEACRLNGIQDQVFVSSVAVYGNTNGVASQEDSPHNPFNDYGKSKSLAETVYLDWYNEAPEERRLIIIRPTVIFGMGNRGNLYNLMRTIAKAHFFMVGDGENRKAIAYVGNVSAFIRYSLSNLGLGKHIFNYADDPNPRVKDLVQVIRDELGYQGRRLPKLPYSVAIGIGHVCDAVSRIGPISLPISAQRVEKFCSPTPVDSQRARSIGFEPPYDVFDALRKTIRDEFGTTTK